MASTAAQIRAKGVSRLTTILIALGAALLAATVALVAHAVRMSRLCASFEVKTLRFLKYGRPMAPREKIERRDLMIGRVREDDAKALGDVVEAHRTEDVVGRRVGRTVQ